MLKKRTIIALVGPTASGKTEISVKLAQKIGGEIISADSRLVYTDFNIGTAKPSKEEMDNIPHHLIDTTDPKETYTANLFKKDAGKIIEEIFARGNIPIIAGGTGFYVKTLLEGLDIPETSPNDEFREKMRKLSEEKGREFIHSKLKEVDPITAAKLHPNDLFRVIRALEVYEFYGKTMAEMQTKTQPNFNTIYIGLNAENREYLYDRINRRVDLMIQDGLIEEVKSLIYKYGKTLSLLKTLGYKEISEHLDGIYSLNEAIELIKKNTRNFAKRQLTWFRANPEIHWLNIDTLGKEQIIEAIIEIYNEQI